MGCLIASNLLTYQFLRPLKYFSGFVTCACGHYFPTKLIKTHHTLINILTNIQKFLVLSIKSAINPRQIYYPTIFHIPHSMEPSKFPSMVISTKYWPHIDYSIFTKIHSIAQNKPKSSSPRPRVLQPKIRILELSKLSKFYFEAIY